MKRCTVLEFTHARVAASQHCWAIVLKYRPGILGEVVAHDDGIVTSEDFDWDWGVEPMRVTV